MNERSRAALGSVLLTASLVAMLGCEDPLTDPAVIAGPRIVGARVGALGDPAVAQPQPGEAATVDWLVLSTDAGAYSAKVAWCVAAPSVIGAPSCAGEPFAEVTATGEYGEALSLGFGVPAELEPGDAWLVWLGICESGEALFDPGTSAFSCASGEVLSGFYRGFVPNGAPNRNPALADDRLVLAGAPWPVLEGSNPPSASGCRESGLPSVGVDQPSSIVFELGGDDRELLEPEPDTYAPHDRESLVYTHLASRAGLDRAFSAIDFDARELRFELPYDFGAEAPPADGETLSFYLLVRDERGGVDWQRRDACLLSP